MNIVYVCVRLYNVFWDVIMSFLVYVSEWKVAQMTSKYLFCRHKILIYLPLFGRNFNVKIYLQILHRFNAMHICYTQTDGHPVPSSRRYAFSAFRLKYIKSLRFRYVTEILYSIPLTSFQIVDRQTIDDIQWA